MRILSRRLLIALLLREWYRPSLAFQRTISSPPQPVTQLDDIQRVWALSDLHSDHVDNMQWLRTRMARGDWNDKDLLVIAGDISHVSSE